MSSNPTAGPAKIAAGEFASQHGRAPQVIARAPGRVNLIGEHTDYNDGFVLPMALPFETVVAAARHPSAADRANLVEVSSVGYGSVSFVIGEDTSSTPRWAMYVHGMANLLHDSGIPVPGWRGVIASDIPIGASLSSSAALEMASGVAMVELAEATVAPVVLARLGQRVENEVIGINSGIMDQLASAASVAGHTSLIDCRSLEIRPVALPEGIVVVVMDTGTRRELVDSEYDDRRAACERAAAVIGVPALRDATMAQVMAIPVATDRDRIDRRRATHVVTENERTLSAADAMERGDDARLGQLMNESHRSLRDDFTVSSEALDRIVEIAVEAEGCVGARMTGGGFAGYAVAAVRRAHVDGFVTEVARNYASLALGAPQLWPCTPHPGASLIA